ncbi:UDP-3-O-(3-hydroxymyristoyl)glucosamine N-acyltransferase [Clostridium sp. AF15-17LB]|nr:UDP-3-O-(3-hydroxymyristoyl)glucosamine N-acyltransferase [Clostridium sp. AF15-17LB]
MKVSAGDIIKLLNKRGKKFEYHGKDNLEISAFSSLSNIKEESIIWVKKGTEETAALIKQIPDLLVVCTPDFYEMYINQTNAIVCRNPKSIYFYILEHFFAREAERKIEDSAIVKTNHIGKNCAVGHYTYIGPKVTLGNNVKIGNHVSIENEVIIGDNTSIGSGTVIGSEGFGYYKDDDGVSIKVPHFGGVEIGKSVEIGANVCIDRGTLDNTVIQDYVKIDNLCHIAHNVRIGAKSKVVALSLLAGSCTLGESVYIAPGTLVKNQIEIGRGSIVGMGSMVLKDIGVGKVVVGAPAKVIRDATEEDMNL